MPFPMIHLCIAKKMIILNPEVIKNLPQFYLGSLAPDSVHFRQNAVSDYKKVTHLCVGNEKWGELTNNSEWLDNVLSFFYTYKQSTYYDFIYGFCAHIIADIYNNINVWTPYRLKQQKEQEKGHRSNLHTESAKVDLQLAQNFEYRDEIWSLLEKSHSLTIPDIVFKDEIDKIKANILYNQYNNKLVANTDENAIVTYSDTLKLIEDATAFVLEKLDSVHKYK